GIRAAGLSRRCGSQRVLYFPTIEPEEDASSSGTDRHLRQAWKRSEAACGQTCRLGRCPSGGRSSARKYKVRRCRCSKRFQSFFSVNVNGRNDARYARFSRKNLLVSLNA